MNYDLFNNVLDSGYFPDSWTKAIILPVFKKGNVNEVKNYRGISLISNLGKLFTSVLNQRLLKWSQCNDVITDAQFGFRPGYGTVDAIFVLNSIISQTLNNKKRLYCAFVDFQTAFDSINRCKLWYKLSKIGIKGKMLRIIHNMYSNVKSCVTVRGFNSEYFKSSLGLMQGEVLSPILFSLYVNDFEKEFISSNCLPYELGPLNLFLLLYADDMILFSDSVEGLQRELNALHECSKSWDLTVNIKKTKIVIFRKSVTINENERFYIGECDLEIVDSFNYLGLCFYYNGRYTQAEKQLSSQARKALFALYKNVKNMYLNVETSLLLFDMYIGSILQYAAEIWGLHHGDCLEKVHLDFCKRLLGVKKSSCNVMIYAELGRLPLQAVRKYKIIKYWAKLLATDNIILKNCYLEMLNTESKNWVKGVRDILFELGFINVWNEQTVNSNLLPIIKQRIFDQAKQSIFAKISVMNKCFLYKHIVNKISLQIYLQKCIPKKYVKYLTMFRLSSHSLAIETGRYQGVLNVNRVCKFCKDDIEDEFHFILKCPTYQNFRSKYIKSYYRTRPSVFKLVQLLSTENVKELCNLGKFLINAYKLRENLNSV